MHTHQEIDQRSLELHRLIVAKIQQDPALLDHVKHTLVRWRSMVCARSQPYLAQWEMLVQQGVCLTVASEDSPWATAMRQSSPFTGILSPQERFAFLRHWPHEQKRA